MKYVDEFRKPELVQRLRNAIEQCLGDMGPVRIMEFCGGHTHTMFRYGIEKLLPPKRIQMMHGPGCPVCVLPMSRVDQCIAIAMEPNVILCSFGDALRVPGANGSLLDAKARGHADVRTVYSPLDALDIALQEPQKQVVFFALGFETTMPSTALTVLQAASQGIENFSLFCNHILTAPTIRALLEDSEIELDGFIAPGHVAMVTGLDEFHFVSKDYGKPLVVSGFEPSDILHSIYMVLQQISQGRAAVENQYKRVVQASGNKGGLRSIAQVYHPHPITELRGFGQIGNAGVRLRPEYQAYDAEIKFGQKSQEIPSQDFSELLQQSRCGEVLKGKLEPVACPLFGKQCLPQSPVGALMVSSEGSCAAYYQHGIRSEVS